MSHGDGGPSIVNSIDKRCNIRCRKGINSCAPGGKERFDWDNHNENIHNGAKTNTIITTANANNNNNKQKKKKKKKTPKTSVDDSEIIPVAPPDGGFGWVVVFSSFCISVIVDGLCYSQGIFFPEFQKEFDTDKSTASWVGSVLTGTYSMVGPLVSALVHVYGCRRVAFIGSIVAAAALSTSTLSPDIASFICIYGLLTGIGFGMMYLPAIVMVGYYFERRRALATGIACCGSGMGTFVFAPLCAFLIEEYGWKGATFVMAGIELSGMFFSLWYRPLENRQSRDANIEKEEKSGELPWEDLSRSISKEENVEYPLEKTASLGVDSNKKGDYGVSRSKSNPESTVTDISSASQKSKTGTSSAFTKSSSKSKTTRPASSTTLAPLQRKDIFYSGDILSLDEYKAVSSITSFRKEMSRPPSRMVNAKTNKKEKKGKWATAFTTVFDIKLLKSPTFLLYSTACSTCMLGFFVPFTYLPLHVTTLGIVEQRKAMLISIIGVTNIVGRIMVGFISDMSCVDCLLINSTALLIGGVATFFVPYYGQYWMFCLYSTVFGMSIAVLTMLRSIIIVELMGLEKLTTAFGFVTLFQGAVSFVGGPIAGAISDSTGSYTGSFYMAGGAIFCSGAMMAPLRRVARWEGIMKH